MTAGEYGLARRMWPQLGYAQMVTEDRELRLAGYEVYRFGGVELVDGPETVRRLNDFFDRLADRHAA